MTVNKLTLPAKANAVQSKINEIIDNLGASITVDQTYDGTSANPQSGVAIEGELSTNYQPKLVSGTNIKTINNTSLLGSGDISVLQNNSDVNATGALSILGDYNLYQGAISIGKDAASYGVFSVSLGEDASAGESSIAIGLNAVANTYSAIQIGEGTNSNSETLSIGFRGKEGVVNPVNYQLLDGSTGLIPDARISSSIARTSQIPTVPTNISAFTNDSGYITGITSSDVTTALSYTPADTTLSNVSSIDSNSAVQTALDGKANTNLSNLTSTSSTNFDGQWTTTYQDIISSDTSVNGSTDLTKRVAVPNDGYVYEAMIMTRASTTSTSGQLLRLAIGTNQLDQDVLVCGLRTRTNNTMEVQATNIVPIKGVATNSTNFTIVRGSGINGNINVMRLIAYRRVGTNA